MLLAWDWESTSFPLCKEKEITTLIFSKQFYKFEIETRGAQTGLKSAWPHMTEKEQ